MKTQKELKELLSQKVEEISLARSPFDTEVRNYNNAEKALSEMQSRIESLSAYASKMKDRPFEQFVTQMKKAHSGLLAYIKSGGMFND